MKKSNKVIEISELAFDSGDEWLQTINFTLRNTSGRAISSIKAELEIRHPALDMPVILPIIPKLGDGRKQSGKLPVLASGEVVVLRLDDHYYRQALDYLKSQGASGQITLSWFNYSRHDALAKI